MRLPTPDLEAIDAALFGASAPSPLHKFIVLDLQHETYSHYVIDPAGVFQEQLSRGISEMARGRAPTTTRDYVAALRLTLDAWWAERPGRLDELFAGTDRARHAIMSMLRANHCTFRNSGRADGSLLVALRDPAGGPARQGHQRIMRTIVTLKHVYCALDTLGLWPHPSPVLVDNHAQMAQLMSMLPRPSWQQKVRYSGLKFVVEDRPNHYPLLDLAAYAPQILAAAADWPPGIRAATALLIATGARISEILSLRLSDWARFDFGRMLSAQDKGSATKRVKHLFLDDDSRSDLVTWVDGARREMTGMSLAEAQRQARRHGAQALSDEALFLGPRGHAISPETYRNRYFRPTMRRLGLWHVTPHRPRHEKAMKALERIRKLAKSPEEEAQLTEDFAKMMGWLSGAEMVHYYAPQIRMQTGQSLAERLFAADDDDDDENLETELDPPSEPPAEDPLLEEFNKGLQL